MLGKRILFLFLLFSCLSFGQSKFNQFLEVSDTLNIKRRNAVVLTESTLATASLVGLNSLWYNDYPRSKFHTIMTIRLCHMD